MDSAASKASLDDNPGSFGKETDREYAVFDGSAKKVWFQSYEVDVQQSQEFTHCVGRRTTAERIS